MVGGLEWKETTEELLSEEPGPGPGGSEGPHSLPAQSSAQATG